jgi:hypothetical protein
MWRVPALAVWLFAAAPLAAQWSVSADVGMLRFWGTAIDTVTPSDPSRARPSPSTGYAVRVRRRFGRVGVGIGVLYSKGGVGVEKATIAVEQKGVFKFYEVAPEISFLVATPGPDGAFRLYVGPMLGRWSLEGGTGAKRVGGRGAVALEWSLGGRWVGTLQGEAAVSAGVIQGEDLPAEFAPRATWRRGVSAGVRVRL